MRRRRSSVRASDWLRGRNAISGRKKVDRSMAAADARLAELGLRPGPAFRTQLGAQVLWNRINAAMIRLEAMGDDADQDAKLALFNAVQAGLQTYERLIRELEREWS